jgi:nucleoside-diphosphate-sugar epimerase
MTINKQIVITGASGWLGKETISVLSNTDFELKLFASEKKNINLLENGNVEANSLDSVNVIGNCEGFIHLAHLTKDKVSKLGQQNFIYENLLLTSKAAQIIHSSKPKWVVLVSSGAIFDPINKEIDSNIATNPYGFGKRVEELIVRNACEIAGSNLVIGRLWGASGKLMVPNSAYALSDLIQNAIIHRQININSPYDVFRKYVNAAQFMEVLVKSAQSGRNLTINSGGFLVEIGEVAKLVAARVVKTKIIRPNYDGSQPNTYYPKDEEFNALASEMGIKLLSIDDQIDLTIRGHKQQLAI